MSKFIWPVVAVVGLGACGSIKDNQLPDAPPPGTDAPDTQAPAPVKVTVLSTAGDGMPDPSAKVVFQAADGTLVQDGAVTSAGAAEAVLATAGGTVTVVRVTADTTTALAADLTTITGVKAGDDLTIGIKPRPILTDQGGATTMTATFPAVPTNTTAVEFFTNCGMSGSGNVMTNTVTLQFRDSCHGAQFDLLGIATGVNLATPQFIRATGVSHVSGGAFAIAGGFLPMASFTVNLTNVPAELSALSGSRASLIGPLAVASQSFSASTPIVANPSFTVPYASNVGSRSELVLGMRRADSTSLQLYEGRTAALLSAATMDLGELTVPWLADVTATPTGATWTVVAPGGTPDGMLVQWRGAWTDAQNRAVSITWRFVQPADATKATLIKLPAAYAALDPSQQTAAVTSTANVIIGDYDRVAGYDELRRTAEVLLPIIGGRVQSPPSVLAAFVGEPFRRRLSATPSR